MECYRYENCILERKGAIVRHGNCPTWGLIVHYEAAHTRTVQLLITIENYSSITADAAPKINNNRYLCKPVRQNIIRPSCKTCDVLCCITWIQLRFYWNGSRRDVSSLNRPVNSRVDICSGADAIVQKPDRPCTCFEVINVRNYNWNKFVKGLRVTGIIFTALLVNYP